MTGRLLAQRSPLFDAEAVLLVDHHRAEAGEGHLVLDEGVRADGDVDRAVGERRHDLLAGAAGHTVREQLDPQRAIAEQVARIGHLEVAEQGPHAGGVLFGEHLGRRHQRTLMTALHRGEQHRHGDDRLAGADVALQQAVHRMRRRQVARRSRAITRC